MTPNLASTGLGAEPAGSATRREIAAIVFLSALVHAGVAGAAYGAQEPRPAHKRVSRVAIEVARRPAPAPLRVTPPVVPPPPPKAVRRELKPQAAPAIVNPQAVASEPPPVSLPVDTGSSAAPAADGELFAGSGGLGTAAPPPPAAPLPVAPQAAPAPVVQAREGANYAKNPRPPYPGRARREGWEGTTLLRVRVNPSGKPGAIQVQRSSGRELLDEAARAAVEKWMFVPASQGGVAVAGWVTVPIVFRLQ